MLALFYELLYHVYIEIKYYSKKKDFKIQKLKNKILKNIKKKNTQNKKISRKRKYTMETNGKNRAYQ